MPIKDFEHSNGHGRNQPGLMPTGRQGNLIVTSSQTVPEKEMRQKLIDEVKKQGKPYGLYFDDIQGGFTLTTRSLPQAFQVLPVIVYKVYADGRPDELVRGVDIVGTPLAALTRIITTGDQQHVFNGVCGAESGSVPVSAVAPAMLFSEMEVQKRAHEHDRPPILPPPGFENLPVTTKTASAKAGGEAVKITANAHSRLLLCGALCCFRRGHALLCSRAATTTRSAAMPCSPRKPRPRAIRLLDALLTETGALQGAAQNGSGAAALLHRIPRQRRGRFRHRSGVRRHARESESAHPPAARGGALGDYKQDSYFGQGQGGNALLPLDNDPIALRHQIWLATDEAYKSAGEALTQKQSILKQFSAKIIRSMISQGRLRCNLSSRPFH